MHTSQPTDQPSDPPATAITSAAPDVARKKRRTRLILVSAGGTALCLCAFLCAAAALWLLGSGGVRLAQERDSITAVVDQFMRVMEAEDAAAAYALFSARAQRQVPLSTLERDLAGSNHVLFEGYQSISLSQLSINAALTTDPDQPQGTVAKALGTVAYEGGFEGTFTAVLEEEDGQWRLHTINVTVPPAKVLSP